MKDRNIEDFDECSQLKTRSKRIGRRKNVIFKTKCSLVPKIAVVRKEEGATAAASHLPSLSGPLRFVVGPVGQRSTMEFSKPSGKLH